MSERDKGRKTDDGKQGLTSWLKFKIRSGAKEESSVDSKFLSDLSDIKTVGRYEIIKKLGQGSMGVVYLGKDPYIDRHVSIKISRPAEGVDGKKVDKYRERFFTEAQSAGRLMHPNIVAIYDAAGTYLGCGITNYSSGDIGVIKGSHSDEIAGLLSIDYGPEVVHRSNLTLLEREEPGENRQTVPVH